MLEQSLNITEQQALMPPMFDLYIDESGSQKPSQKDTSPFFAMGGVIVRRADEAVIESLLEQFKERWDIERKTPLHATEIRSKKKRFAWLGNLPQQEHDRFMEDLTNTIVSCPVVVHACVISRSGYLKRYFQEYGADTWEMMRSAFSILVERAAKYAASKKGAVMVYYEKAGKTEDKLIEHYFRTLRSTGHPFDPTTANKYSPMPASQLSELLRGIEGRTKNAAELQLADLCLYPVVRSKDQSDNRAFVAMKKEKLIVDCHLEPHQVETLGVKYYCFDSP